MATERQILGQAQRILVDATNQIWHKISLWTHASDVEMPNGDPLNEFLTDMNDDLNEKIDGKYNSYHMTTTGIGSLDQIPAVGHSRIQTTTAITAGDYTIPYNHYCYCYSGKDPNSIEKMAVMIDTTDLTNIVMYIAHYSIEARWTLTKIANQKQIDALQDQINNLSNRFNELNLYVQESVGNLNARYQIIQNQMDWLEAELAELQEFLNDLLNELRDFKREINGRVDALSKTLKDMYGQIGSLFITGSSLITASMLAEWFGGEWALAQGGYLFAGGPHLVPHPGGGSFTADSSFGNKSDIPKYKSSEVAGNFSELSKENKHYDFASDSAIGAYGGRSHPFGFALEKRNLPPHYHVFDSSNNDVLATTVRAKNNAETTVYEYEIKDSCLNTLGNNSDSKYVIQVHRKDRMKKNSLGAYVTEYYGVDNQDVDGSFKGYPIPIFPRALVLYVWARIA